MKILVLIITTIISLQVTVFGQCSANLTGSDPIWCMSCNGIVAASVTGNPPFHYQWSTMDTTYTVDSLCAGTYTLTLTDNTGCSVTESITLTQTPPMNVNITTTPASCSTCSDGVISFIISDGCVGYNISTIPPDAFWMPSQSFPGDYIIVVCDICGCCVQDSVTVGFSTVVLNEPENSISLSYQIQNNTVTFSMPISNLTLYDSFGSLIFKFANKETKQIMLPELPTGIYLLRALTNNGGLWADKLLIINK